RITAGDDEVRPLRNDDVGIDAVVFHDPLAAIVRGPECKFRRGDVAAVVQRYSPRDADEAAPGARAYDGPNLLAMEKPWEGIASGTGEFVDDHNLRTINRHRRPWSVFAFARSECGEKLAAEFLGVEIGNLSAGIVTLIDDHAVLVELRGELLVERDDSGK